MMLEETIRILSMQEEILQFPHFTNKDAWELGSYMVSEAAHNGLPVVISIRLNKDIPCSSMDSKEPIIVMKSG